MTIDRFTAKYRFLSNFYRHEFDYKGITYRTAEHAYQAAKASSISDSHWIKTAPSPQEAKRRGRRVILRPDWEEVKVNIMGQILEAKFADPGMAERLKDTWPHSLIEGNHWGDTFWGTCNGFGRNELGQALMRVRSKLGKSKPIHIELFYFYGGGGMEGNTLCGETKIANDRYQEPIDGYHCTTMQSIREATCPSCKEELRKILDGCELPVG